MKRPFSRWPRLVCLAAGLLVLAVSHTVLSPALAQREVPPPGEGSHLFRRIVNDAINLQPDSSNLQPLESLDQLAEEPEKTLLIVLGETDVLDRLQPSFDKFLKQGGAALVATDRD